MVLVLFCFVFNHSLASVVLSQLGFLLEAACLRITVTSFCVAVEIHISIGNGQHAMVAYIFGLMIKNYITGARVSISDEQNALSQSLPS